MPKSKLHSILIAILGLISFSGFAQNSSTKTPVVTSKGVKVKEEAESSRLSIDNARKQTIASFNLFRDYSVTLDTLMASKGTETEPSYVVKESSPTYFKIYLSKMDGSVRRKIETLPESSTKLAEQEKLTKVLTMLKSAECFANRDKGAFIATTDQQGNAIVAFPLDSLR